LETFCLAAQAPAHVDSDGDAHTAEAEAKAAEAETKSVEAGREENLTSFSAGHDTATLGQLRPIFSHRNSWILSLLAESAGVHTGAWSIASRSKEERRAGSGGGGG
jgi:hypothetical protein